MPKRKSFPSGTDQPPPRRRRRTSPALEETELLKLIGDIYDAGLSFEQWPSVLSRLSELCGAKWGPMVGFPLAAGTMDPFQTRT
jgi:hypothetical protein